MPTTFLLHLHLIWGAGFIFILWLFLFFFFPPLGDGLRRGGCRCGSCVSATSALAVVVVPSLILNVSFMGKMRLLRETTLGNARNEQNSNFHHLVCRASGIYNSWAGLLPSFQVHQRSRR